MTPDGEKAQLRPYLDNDPIALALDVAEAGADPEVAIEACYGWYWAGRSGSKLEAPRSLSPTRSGLRLEWPAGQYLTRSTLTEPWPMAADGPPARGLDRPARGRELRELVRYRAKLVALRFGFSKPRCTRSWPSRGSCPALDDMFGPGGQRLLDEMPLDRVYTVRVESLRDLIEIYDREVAMLEREIHSWLRDDKGYAAIQAIDGVGKTMAAIFVAEIGDVSRFASADQLCSWAGLTPRHRESDTKVSRGRITKMGSTPGALGGRGGRRPLPRRRTHPRPPTHGSPPDGAARSPASPRPASSSPWSTSACATARSAAWPTEAG